MAEDANEYQLHNISKSPTTSFFQRENQPSIRLEISKNVFKLVKKSQRKFQGKLFVSYLLRKLDLRENLQRHNRRYSFPNFSHLNALSVEESNG